jgi:hypothetical protein
MNTEVIQKRFNDFKSRFSQLFGPKNDGYEELDTLERPLVSDMDNPLYEAGDDTAYVPPGAQHGAHHRQASSNFHVPSQQEELELLTILSKDAAEILWEMVLLKDADGASADDVQDMKARSEQLRAQLRGMLNDYDGSDEMLMCRALEAWDSLNSALDGDVGAQGGTEEARAVNSAELVAPGDNLLGLGVDVLDHSSAAGMPGLDGSSAVPVSSKPEASDGNGKASQNAPANLIDF